MSLDKRKIDPELGEKIHLHLKKHKVESPLFITSKTPEFKVELITKKFTEILKVLCLDIRDDNLNETAARIAKMYVYETLWGLDYNNFPKMTTFEDKSNTAMIIERKINVTCLCMHHWQNIIGKCHIAYIPKGRLLGLSKLHRIVEFFSRRPQIQEKLVEQIYYALSFILHTEDIALTIVAEHFCIVARGVEDHASDTVTTKLGGCFINDLAVRSEYYTTLKL